MLKGIDFECALAIKGYRLADARMRMIIAVWFRDTRYQKGEREHTRQ
jgi:hypothetical protein